MLIVCVIACALGGWDTRFAALTLAALCGTAVLFTVVWPSARARLGAGPMPWLAAACGAVLLAWGLVQATPGLGFAHPEWAALLGQEAQGALSLHPHATRGEVVKLAGLGAAFALGVAAGRDRRGVERCVRALLAAITAYATMSLTVYLVAAAFLGGGDRLYAGLGSANAAALVFGSGLVLAVASLLRALAHGALQGVSPLSALDGLFRAAPLGCWGLAACSCALLLTLSRAGVAFTAVSVLALLAAEAAARVQGRDHRRVILGGLAALAVAFTLFGGPFLSRLETTPLLEDPRGAIFQAHARAASDAWLTGHGLGSFGIVNNLYMTVENTGALAPVGAAHNAYLQWWEEAGLIGAGAAFLALGFVLVPIFRHAARTLQRARRAEPMPQAHWTRASAALGLLFLAHAAVDYALNIYAIAVAAAVWTGMAWAAAQRARDDMSDIADGAAQGGRTFTKA